MASGVGELLMKKTADLPNWAWLAVVVVGGGVGVYFVRRQQNAATSTTSAPGSSASVNATSAPDTSAYEVGNQPVSPDYSTNGTPSSPVYVISSQTTPPPDSGNTNPPPTPTPTPTPTQTLIIRQRVGNLGSSVGVPFDAKPGASQLGVIPYGTHVQATGPEVNGPNNNPQSGGPGSTLWYPITYSGKAGFISAYDVAGMGGGVGGPVRREMRVPGN